MEAFKKKFPPLRSQSGGSLVIVLVALALVGLMAAMMATINDNSMQLQRKMITRGEMEATRSLVRTRFNCTNTTLAMPAGCKSDPATNKRIPISLWSRNNNLFVKLAKKSDPAGSFTKRGAEYELQSACFNNRPGGGEILVNVRRTPKRARNNIGKLVNIAYGNPPWQDLFNGIPLPCAY